MSRHEVGHFEERPWGSFEVLAVAKDCEVKRLIIKPSKRLSDQRHRGRREVWVAVEGGGLVDLEDGRKEPWDVQLFPGETVTIPRETWHRLHNTSEDKPLVIIEVWLGDCDEDDNERRADDHGRV